MDLEAIPGLWDKVNTEIHSMNEEVCSHQNEQGDADDTPGGANASVDLDRSISSHCTKPCSGAFIQENHVATTALLVATHT